MATADEIRAKIAARQKMCTEMDAELAQDDQEIANAEERQRLRRQLDELERSIRMKSLDRSWKAHVRKGIDQDERGPAAPGNKQEGSRLKPDYHQYVEAVSQCALDCQEAVIEGETEWTIKGFSWLEDTLSDMCYHFAESSSICVAGHDFSLCYSPEKGAMNSEDDRASLAIKHWDVEQYDGVTFRYTIWIKSKHRGYVQWGDSGSVCLNDPAEDRLFGPDVCNHEEVPDGIFGLSHAELLHSEWVVDDTLTVKLKVWVRPKRSYLETTSEDVHVLASSSGDKLAQLFESGVNSDVTFILQGEEIQAHSQILSAFSDVFQTQFSCGMQESSSKRVLVEDCEPPIFKAFLRYLYSSSFKPLDDVIAEVTSARSSASDRPNDGAVRPNEVSLDRLTVLKQLLALSHKHHELRLQQWTERALCKCISVEDVCPVLCQAHLYEAKLLETKCLDFIAAHRNEVAKSVAFGSLGQEWPQVSLKITLRLAGVSKDTTVTAMKNQENARKKRRLD